MRCVSTALQHIDSAPLSCVSVFAQNTTMTVTTTFNNGASNGPISAGVISVTSNEGAVNGFGIAYIAVSRLDRLLLSRQP
jgi:hypothetical protein